MSNTLAQNSISNCWSGMYLAWKSNQVTCLKRTGMQHWVLNVGQCGSKSDCENRTGTEIGQMVDTPVLGVAGSHCLWKLPRNWHCYAGMWLQRPRVISVMNAALFVGQSAANMRLPPERNWNKRDWVEEFESLVAKQEEALHLFRCFTHTPSHRRVEN